MVTLPDLQCISKLTKHSVINLIAYTEKLSLKIYVGTQRNCCELHACYIFLYWHDDIFFLPLLWSLFYVCGVTLSIYRKYIEKSLKVDKVWLENLPKQILSRLKTSNFDNVSQTSPFYTRPFTRSSPPPDNRYTMTSFTWKFE